MRRRDRLACSLGYRRADATCRLIGIAHIPDLSVGRFDPNWAGTYVTTVDTSAEERLAIVEFDRCLIYKFGGPNDEVISGYPLYGKGLEAYGAHIVERSRWIAEQQQINSVHRHYDPQSWGKYKHYVLLFHDEIFECIAVGHSIEQR